MGTKYDKLNKIYFWFHEIEGENVYLVSESFRSFIFNFQKIKNEKNNLDNITLNLGDKLNAFLTKASKDIK